jgi:hypothetical protein
MMHAARRENADTVDVLPHDESIVDALDAGSACIPEQNNARTRMTTSTHVSAYERRLKMVEDVLTGRTELDGKAARDLAVHVLRALDHIPERVR